MIIESVDKFSIKTLEKKSKYDFSINDFQLRIVEDCGIAGYDISYKYDNSCFYVFDSFGSSVNSVSEIALVSIENDIEQFNKFCCEPFNFEHEKHLYDNLTSSLLDGIKFINISFTFNDSRVLISSYISKQVSIMGNEYSYKTLYRKAMVDFSDEYKVKKEAQRIGLL